MSSDSKEELEFTAEDCYVWILETIGTHRENAALHLQQAFIKGNKENWDRIFGDVEKGRQLWSDMEQRILEYWRESYQ